MDTTLLSRLAVPLESALLIATITFVAGAVSLRLMEAYTPKDRALTYGFALVGAVLASLIPDPNIYRLATVPLLPAALGALAAGLAVRTWATHLRNKRIEALVRALTSQGPLTMSVVGPYRVLELLGTGARAHVYRAIPNDSLQAEKAVAIKVFEGGSQEQDFLQRFYREVLHCSELDHPNLVKVHTMGCQDGLYYIALELLEGESLSDHIVPPGLPWPQALGILKQLASGLEHMHSRGVIHRDLKPDNILVKPDGEVKILDLGYARGPMDQSVTRSNCLVGTPSYIAPELLMHEPTFLDPRIDQYALGMLAFELFTGRKVFKAQNFTQLVELKLQSTPASLKEARPGLPTSVSQLVDRMMHNQPDRRFPNMTEVLVRLEEVELYEELAVGA